MIDLSREPQKREPEPSAEQIVMLVLCIMMWTVIIVGSMMS